jgi:hypothetical protein
VKVRAEAALPTPGPETIVSPNYITVGLYRSVYQNRDMGMHEIIATFKTAFHLAYLPRIAKGHR